MINLENLKCGCMENPSGIDAVNFNAKWIWKNAGSGINEFAYFRKEINIKKDVNIAKVYVSAHNHFELYIAGEKVSGYVTPAPTHPQKSKYYLCYDITNLLTKGMNSICAIVHYLGGGGQNYVNGLPGFILQCEIEYCDNVCETFITDTSWKVLGETSYKNGTEFQQKRKMSAIEDYDATFNNRWLLCGFDDSKWNNAYLSAINTENWVMKQQIIPEGRAYEVIVPNIVGVQEKGLQVFDTGKIITGWPRVELKGIKADQIMLRYSEDITEDGRVKHNVCNEKSENYYDLYRMRGENNETWEPSFSYKAFRYVEVTGYPEMLRPENIKIISAGTGLSYEGSFNCSNSLLNNIYKACIQTQKNNVVGQMVDCPHREQAQYLADSDLQAETFIYNFSNPEVLKKVLFDFKDGQFEDGRFQFVFPSNINPQFDIKIPEWDLHFCTMLWKIYFAYDDRKLLDYCYEAAKKTVSYYLKLRDTENGLVPKGEGFPEAWNISDWPYPNIDHKGKALTVQNCLLYHVLGLMSQIASILGLDEDQTEFKDQAIKLRESIIKHLYNPVSKLFVDSLGSEQCHQGTNVAAYQFGLVPTEDRGKVLEFIVGEGFDCSTLLSLNMLQVLFENIKGQAAYDILNKATYPGWGYMIEKGYKTIWEGFKNIESHSHAWNAYPARIFTEYIVGIRAASPGFKDIDIKPFIPDGLTFAESTVPTISGSIYTRWEKTEDEVTIKVKIPANTEAQIFIPKFVDKYKAINESGKLIWKNSNFIENNCSIKYIQEDNKYISFSFVSGEYIFIAEL